MRLQVHYSKCQFLTTLNHLKHDLMFRCKQCFISFLIQPQFNVIKFKCAWEIILPLWFIQVNRIHPQEGNMLQQERTKMETKNKKVIKEAWRNKKNEVKKMKKNEMKCENTYYWWNWGHMGVFTNLEGASFLLNLVSIFSTVQLNCWQFGRTLGSWFQRPETFMLGNQSYRLCYLLVTLMNKMFFLNSK